MLAGKAQMSPSATPSGGPFTCPGKSILSNQFRQLISPSPFPTSSPTPSQSQPPTITPSQSQLPTPTPTNTPFENVLPPGVPPPKLEFLPQGVPFPSASGSVLPITPPDEFVFPFVDFAYNLQGALSFSTAFLAGCTEGRLTYSSAQSFFRSVISRRKTALSISSHSLDENQRNALNVTSVERSRSFEPIGIQLWLVFMKGNFRRFVHMKLKETLKKNELITTFRFTKTIIKKTRKGTVYRVFAKYTKAFLNSLPTWWLKQ